VGPFWNALFLFTDAEYAHRDNTLKEQTTRAKRNLTHHAPVRYRLPGPEVRVPVGQRMLELAQRRWLQAMRSQQGDERSYEIHGP
jgi:hypothetical protein